MADPPPVVTGDQVVKQLQDALTKAALVKEAAVKAAAELQKPAPK